MNLLTDVSPEGPMDLKHISISVFFTIGLGLPIL